MTAVRMVYFAWVRERIGLEEEWVEPPAEVTTAGELVSWLAGRGDNYAYALSTTAPIRVALDRMHVEHDEPIAGAREIALFPPMTGG